MIVTVVLLSAAMFLSPVQAEKQVYIGISKIVAHPALDALEQGVQDGVKKISQCPV